MIAIVDYRVGNLQSVINAFEMFGKKAKLESDPEKLKEYDRIILPGVGAFGDAMESLRKTGMKEAVIEYVKSGKYLLGICLGMQLLLKVSYEFGEHKGLGLIDGEVEKFNISKCEKLLKIPHMGWNELHVKRKSPLFSDLQDSFYLYFVHSYHVTCKEENIIGKSQYGYNFASAIQKNNIIGLQPHPEKSHENGLKILKNFSNL